MGTAFLALAGDLDINDALYVAALPGLPFRERILELGQ
jgi:hypothetical protein